MSELAACLPADLRGPATTIAKIGVGLSGAGVYRVEAGGAVYVLKVAPDGEADDAWQRKIELVQAAARAGLAPAVVHVDRDRRAIVSAFVADHGFMLRVGDPRTRGDALALLGATLRRVHDLPLAPDAVAADPRALLAHARAAAALPPFAHDAIRRVLDEEPPPSGRAPVTSHNDVNPTNLALDGDRLLLFDWDVAGPNDPFYDLAAIAVFLRLDDAACRALLAAHDGAPVAALPARFLYDRRLIAALCGALGVMVSGATAGAETLDDALALGDFYVKLRSGALSLATPEGRRAFGLALLKQSLSL